MKINRQSSYNVCVT